MGMGPGGEGGRRERKRRGEKKKKKAGRWGRRRGEEKSGEAERAYRRGQLPLGLRQRLRGGGRPATPTTRATGGGACGTTGSGRRRAPLRGHHKRLHVRAASDGAGGEAGGDAREGARPDGGGARDRPGSVGGRGRKFRPARCAGRAAGRSANPVPARLGQTALWRQRDTRGAPRRARVQSPPARGSNWLLEALVNSPCGAGGSGQSGGAPGWRHEQRDRRVAGAAAAAFPRQSRRGRAAEPPRRPRVGRRRGQRRGGRRGRPRADPRARACRRR